MILTEACIQTTFHATLYLSMFQLVAKRYNNDWGKMRALSIIEEEGGKRVNMAHLVSSTQIYWFLDPIAPGAFTIKW